METFRTWKAAAEVAWEMPQHPGWTAVHEYLVRSEEAHVWRRERGKGGGEGGGGVHIYVCVCVFVRVCELGGLWN